MVLLFPPLISFLFLQNELCLSPVQMSGVVWVEIMYRSPYSLQCMKLENNLTAVESSDSGDNCHKTFLFVGDVISMARSVSMTSFQPRFASPFGAYLADMLEKLFACTFQVSVALALLNSLPVCSVVLHIFIEIIHCVRGVSTCTSIFNFYLEIQRSSCSYHSGGITCFWVVYSLLVLKCIAATGICWSNNLLGK